MKRIVCFHLFNDYSGSPRLLKTVLDGLLERGWHVDLVTSTGGVLEKLKKYPNLTFHGYNYRFSENRFVTSFRYLWVQTYTFVFALRFMLSKDTVFYINTLLPVGPAFAGKLMGKRVVYHYHENAFAKGVAYRGLANAMQILADKIICVSSYQASMLDKKDKTVIVPNALDPDVTKRLKAAPKIAYNRQNVLMISSLKKYKGINEFFFLSSRLQHFSFTLVVNEEAESIKQYIRKESLIVPKNLLVLPRQEDVSRIYMKASLLLNLTNKDFAIETFGLTTLEAMTAGLPVIVPSVGGISEMVEDGINGYKIDVSDLSRITEVISNVLTDWSLYQQLSDNALSSSVKYKAEKMIPAVIKVIDGV